MQPIWFSYRFGFELEGFVSDVGWGCMHRTGQMLLAKCLQMLGHSDKEIIPLFYDNLTQQYSIQQIVRMAGKYSKGPGEWLNPTTLALVLQDLVSHFKVVVATNSCLATSQISDYPILILLPLRLGIESLNQKYFSLICDFIDHPNSVGIVGGKQNSSLYFTRRKDSTFYYLDPHTNQDIATENDFSSYYTHELTMPVELIDPSILVGFLCFSLEQSQELCEFLRKTEVVEVCEQISEYESLEEFEVFE